jgi:hypothetical protein
MVAALSSQAWWTRTLAVSSGDPKTSRNRFNDVALNAI